MFHIFLTSVEWIVYEKTLLQTKHFVDPAEALSDPDPANFDQLLCSGHPCLIQKPSSANQATLWLTLCLRFEDSSKSNIHGVAWPHVQHGVTGVTPTFRTQFVWYILSIPILLQMGPCQVHVGSTLSVIWLLI
jgi:hypothetical protein